MVTNKCFKTAPFPKTSLWKVTVPQKGKNKNDHFQDCFLSIFFYSQKSTTLQIGSAIFYQNVKMSKCQKKEVKKNVFFYSFT